MRFGADRITLLKGDAAQILPQLEGTFDFIFMDAAKGQYIRFLPEVIRLMRPGAVLLSDNVLKEGEILASKFAVTRRNRTIHKRMREYLNAISDDPRLRTVLLETGDGAALSVRRRTGSKAYRIRTKWKQETKTEGPSSFFPPRTWRSSGLR